MPTVLLTQCLQRDFVDPLRPGDPLPNKLHVGAVEARRLLGDDPAASPLAQLLAWARTEPTVHLVHIRDWHDPDDAAQHTHLATFGAHCVRDTPGARFVVDPPDGAHEHVVDAVGLNDFEGTRLREVLEPLAAQGPLRVGVIGVWTDAKVSFLLYDLATRMGVESLATCSALTASSSRARHFQALDQLERLLGVRVFHDVAGFADWLSPGARPAPPPPRRGGAPSISWGGGAEPPRNAPPSDDGDPTLRTDHAIVAHLFRDSTEVALEPLAGGFSGARVYRAHSRDVEGHQQADTVVKLGPTCLLGPERAATERIAEILGNNVPTIRGYVDFGDRAGLRYAWAAMGTGGVRTFKRLWEDGADDECVANVLSTALEEVLEPLWAAARFEPLALVEHLQFARWSAGVRASVEAILGHPADTDTFTFPGGYTARNLCLSYEVDLPALPVFPGQSHLVSQVHGDLNTANILVDTRGNVWVIDFARSQVGPVLQDLAKLENDLLYILTPLETEDDLAEGLKLTSALRAVVDLRQPLPEACLSDHPAMRRAWAALRVLRGIGGRMCREERNPITLHLLLLRYAAHTLGFDEASPLQKRWALAAACGHAEDAVAAIRAQTALRVDRVAGTRLGLTLCPGRRDKGRHLDADLDTLVQGGARRLLSLVPLAELAQFGVGGLLHAARTHGLAVHHLPIVDQRTPTLDEARAAVRWVRAGLAAGEDVVIHCIGGLGRTGTLAACVLVDGGATAAEAIAAVRVARGPRAVESIEQERFVARYAAQKAVDTSGDTPADTRGDTSRGTSDTRIDTSGDTSGNRASDTPGDTPDTSGVSS